MKVSVQQLPGNLSRTEKKEFLFRFLLVGVVVLFSLLVKEVVVSNETATKNKPISLRVR
jgi:hypothetical protein